MRGTQFSWTFIVAAAIAVRLPALAVTTILSANGQPWEVDDITSADNGRIIDGGQDAFDGWGGIRLRVLDGSNNILTSDQELSGFGLTWDGGRRFATTTPVMVSDLSVSRALFAPSGTDYMRYIDTFTNTAAATRVVFVAWGGNLGSNGDTTLAATSSGDLSITNADTWAVTIENDSFDPAGPATDPPVGYAFRAATDQTFAGTGDYFSNPFTTPWSGNGDDTLGYVYSFTLAPGASASLGYFLYRGLEENATGPLGQSPTTGQEITLAKATVAAIIAAPNFSDLGGSERLAIKNFPPSPSTVEPAPTMSGWILIMVALILMWWGFFAVRSRSSEDATP